MSALEERYLVGTKGGEPLEVVVGLVADGLDRVSTVMRVTEITTPARAELAGACVAFIMAALGAAAAGKLSITEVLMHTIRIADQLNFSASPEAEPKAEAEPKVKSPEASAEYRAKMH